MRKRAVHHKQSLNLDNPRNVSQKSDLIFVLPIPVSNFTQTHSIIECPVFDINGCKTNQQTEAAVKKRYTGTRAIPYPTVDPKIFGLKIQKS